jgi:hypothetical protein
MHDCRSSSKKLAVRQLELLARYADVQCPDHSSKFVTIDRREEAYKRAIVW